MIHIEALLHHHSIGCSYKEITEQDRNGSYKGLFPYFFIHWVL